jgi:hypothetical protein
LALSAIDQAREDVKTLFEFGELNDYVSNGGKAQIQHKQTTENKMDKKHEQ